MFKFIKYQFELNKITPEQVLAFVPRWITSEEAELILHK